MKFTSISLSALLVACATASAGLVDFEKIGLKSSELISPTYQPLAGLTIQYENVGIYNLGGDHSTGSGFSSYGEGGGNSTQKFMFDKPVNMPSVWLTTYFGGNSKKSLDVKIRAYSDEAGTALLRESVVATQAHPDGKGYVWSEFTGFSDLNNIRRLEFSSEGNAQVDDMNINMVPESADAADGIAPESQSAAESVSIACKNPGFETGDFTGWTTSGKGWTIDTQSASEGTASALCTVGKGDGPQLRACLQKIEGIPAGKILEASLDVSATDAYQTQNSTAFLAILCFDGRGELLNEYRTSTPVLKPTFRHIKIDDAVVLPGTEQVYVMLVVEVYQTASDNDFWRFDNVRLQVR